MPGYNHYSWCMCGWCYKTGSNGYARRTVVVDFGKSYAMRTLKEHGAHRSWTACFVNPNASCPVCFAKVYYYQNQHGSRVFFDELGWPWPKHPCTDNSKSSSGFKNLVAARFVCRTRGTVGDIMEAAKAAHFDPSTEFRARYGRSPFDLLKILDLRRKGFDNFIKAESVSPLLDEPRFIAFTSAKFVPAVGDYFSLDANEVSFIQPDTLTPHTFKARELSPEAFAEADAEASS